MRISDWSSDVCSSDLWLADAGDSDGTIGQDDGQLALRAGQAEPCSPFPSQHRHTRQANKQCLIALDQLLLGRQPGAGGEFAGTDGRGQTAGKAVAEAGRTVENLHGGVGPDLSDNLTNQPDRKRGVKGKEVSKRGEP